VALNSIIYLVPIPPKGGVDLFLNISGTPSAVTNAGGIVNFDLGASAPDALEIEVSGASIATQTFSESILAGEGNTVEIEVAV
jgi:hypothetical protein